MPLRSAFFFYSTVNEGGCQLSLPARTYAVTCPVSMTLVYNIIALIRTAFAIKKQSQVIGTV